MKKCFLLILFSAVCIAAPLFNSFNFGELSPWVKYRVDIEQRNLGVETLENMYVKVPGAACRRPGTEYITSTKNNGQARLIPFEYATEDTYVLEFGDEYIRFFRDGGRVLTGVGTEDISDVNDNVVAHWLLNDDESITAVLDNEGNHDGDATENTSEIYNENGAAEGCFDLDGSESVYVDDHADFSFDDSGDNPFTLTAWVFVTNATEQQTILSKWKEATAMEYRLFLDSSEKLYLHISDATADVSGDCVSQWKLNETSGTTVTDSRGTQDGIATTDISGIYGEGKIETAFNFIDNESVEINDNADYSFGDGSDDSAFSVTAWAYWDGESGQTVVSKWSDNSKREWRMYQSQSTYGPYFYIYDESTDKYAYVLSSFDEPSVGWHFYVFTYDGTGGASADDGMTFYIDGEVPGDQYSSTQSGYDSMEDKAAKVVIGGHYNAADDIVYTWDERVDNVCIFDKELSANEVTALYATGNGTESLTINASAYAKSDDSITNGWRFICATYNSVGGASPADGITLYVDGNSVDSTAYNDSSYTSMQDTAIKFRIGAEIDSSADDQYIWADKLDNIAIFADDFNATEIASLYSTTQYEIESPYSISQRRDLHHVQINDVMYLVCSQLKPYKLLRYDHSHWALEAVNWKWGPFLDQNIDTTKSITPSDEPSDITSTAYAISSTDQAGETDDEAFDDILTNNTGWGTDNVDTDSWIGQNFGARKTVTRMKVYPCHYSSNDDACPKHIKVEASNDGVTYTKISINKWYGRIEGYNGDEAYVDEHDTYDEYFDLYLDNDKGYEYWRLWITDNWGDERIYILEIEMFEDAPQIFTASADIWDANHIGSIWKIIGNQEKSFVKGTFDSAALSDTLAIEGDYLFTVAGTYNALVTLEKSGDFGASWQAVYPKLSSGDAVDTEYAGDEAESGYIYRVKMSDYTSGSNVDYSLTGYNPAIAGYIKITDYHGPNEVVATVESPIISDELTTRWAEGSWSDYRGWPRAITLYQNRLALAGTEWQRNGIWFSASTDYESMEVTSLDSSAINYEVASCKQSPIMWLQDRGGVVAGTSGSIIKIQSQSANSTLTKTTIGSDIQNAAGSSSLQAQLLNDSIIFADRDNKTVKDMIYDLQTDGFISPELSVLAEHIIEPGIVEMAVQNRPEPIVWFVIADGDCISMTYNQEQTVIGFSRHVTNGDFESVAVIPSGENEDEVWFVINRTIDTNTVRYVERLKPQEWGTDQNDMWFVDCGASYSGSETDTITGLSYLEGETVQVFYDVNTFTTKTVSGGQIVLDSNVTECTVGLPYTSTLQTFPIEMPVQGGYSVGHRKKIYETVACFYKSMYGDYGYVPMDNDPCMWPILYDDNHSGLNGLPIGSDTPFTGIIRLEMDSDSEDEVRVKFTQDEPFPFNITALSFKMGIND